MRILVAPNAMKGSLPAKDFSDAIEAGILSGFPEAKIIKLPVADGGDGTLEVVVANRKGEQRTVAVHNPVGELIKARYGWLPESKLAVIEMSEASGLRLIPPEKQNPMKTSTRGTGELITAALDAGAEQIILGIGGSATVDGGLGMMKALGMRFLDEKDNEVSDGGEGVGFVRRIDTSQLHPALRSCKIQIACDVNNPLLGDKGAARVFGPQKGATPEMVNVLERNLAQYSLIVAAESGKDWSNIPGVGAAGGMALPLLAFCRTKLKPGAELILEILKLDNYLGQVDWVITGEGRIDRQTANEKAPWVVARHARHKKLPVTAICGSYEYSETAVFDGVFSITEGPITLTEAMKSAAKLVTSAATELGKLLKTLDKRLK